MTSNESDECGNAANREFNYQECKQSKEQGEHDTNNNSNFPQVKSIQCVVLWREIVRHDDGGLTFD